MTNDAIITLPIGKGGTSDPIWRCHASALAYRRGIVGQAQRVNRDPAHEKDTLQRYLCVSVSTVGDYELLYNRRNGELWCPCEQGRFGRPCSHAGAVLQLITGCAPERERTPDGVQRFSEGESDGEAQS